MRLLFTFTIFVGSGLLFLVEPMVAKMILPRFGGAAAVWTASVVFFQVALLLGYAYAHLSVKWLGPRLQAIAHVAMVLLGLLFLPIALPSGEGAISTLSVMSSLAAMVGVPFFLLAAGAPLIQRWFATTGHSLAPDPYFLYGASNLGSMVALLAYPVLVEPNLGLAEQARLWKMGYVILAVLLLACAVALWRLPDRRTTSTTALGAAAPASATDGEGGGAVGQALSDHRRETPHPLTPSPLTNHRGEGERLWWVALAAIPASLLLGVTTHITVVVAPMPLLWVVPLALYLLSFILAFAQRPILQSKPLSWIALVLIAPLALSLMVEIVTWRTPQLSLHLAGLLLISWACHRTLAEHRPQPARLTEFFFFIALGGVIGGLFNSLVAPLLFKSLAEYPIALVAAALLLPRGRGSFWRPLDLAWVILPVAAGIALMQIDVMRHWPPDEAILLAVVGTPLALALLCVGRPFSYALSLAALFVAAAVTNVADEGTVVYRDRSFFGVHDVQVYGAEHRLMNGTTTHGIQVFDEDTRREPVSYYAREGPIGKVVAEKSKSGKKPAIAVVGLGAGTMSAYGQPGQTVDFYEIDPTVVKTARDTRLFTYLADSQAKVGIYLGDARQSLLKAGRGAYDIIVLDAFSSDAIPVHLLTLEAIRMYLTKLASGGVLAFHITSKYLDLEPILANASIDLDLAALDDTDYGYPEDSLTYNSEWLIVARRPSDFGSLAGSPDWEIPTPDPTLPTWTDDRTSLLWPLVRFLRRQEE